MRRGRLGEPLRGAWSAVRADPAAPLVVLGLALLALAWCFGPTPFSAPDETAHYVRAIELGGGELVGEVAHLENEPLTAEQRAWVAQAERQVQVPAALFPVTNCGVFEVQEAPTCIEDVEAFPVDAPYVTSTGTYDPAPYVLPGLAMRGAPGSLSALWLGRIVMAVQTLALLGSAVLVVARRFGPTAVLGLVAGVTPTVMATITTVNPSGVEIAAGIALGAALLSLDAGRRGAWMLGGLAALALCLSRSSGIAWAAGLVGLAVLWHGPRGVAALVRRRRAEAAGLALALVGGAVGSQVWAALYGPTVEVVQPTRVQLGDWYEFFALTVYQQAIGWFGHYDLQLPAASYWAWGVALLTLGVGALLLGRGPRRLLFVVALAVLLTVPAVLYLAIIEQTGFGPQARHVLPVVTVLPLLAGVLLADGRRLRPPAGFLLTVAGAGVALVLAGVQLHAWWQIARRTAVGIDGPWLFVGRSAWSPAGGWALWAAVAILGTLVLAGGLILGLVRGGRGDEVAPERGPGGSGRADDARADDPRATTVAEA